MSGGDRVQLGFAASLNQPGGNVAGVTFLVGTLAAKLLGLLRDLLPQAARIAVLTDPNIVSG
jgi:putative ABC transport system substrate-binding protein